MKPIAIPYLSDGHIEHFWAHVNIEMSAMCWDWTGYATKGGYGQWSAQGRSFKPHRIAYHLKHGPIPDGLTIDHLCKNKLCCNPAHLEPVTQSENTLRYTRALPLTCKHGHERERGKPCKPCCVIAVAKSQAKNPDKYREMKKMNSRNRWLRVRAG